MPTGDEWLLPLSGDVETLKECAEVICAAWPGAVVEDTAAGEFAFSVEALVPAEESELCVYRNMEVTRRWQRGGPSKEVRNSMIQIEASPRGVRLIADDWRDPVLREITARLESVARGG